jgi:hypothetical protein
MVLDLVKANERIIADLMDVSDAVRREAMQTLTDQAGHLRRNDRIRCGIPETLRCVLTSAGVST